MSVSTGAKAIFTSAAAENSDETRLLMPDNDDETTEVAVVGESPRRLSASSRIAMTASGQSKPPSSAASSNPSSPARSRPKSGSAARNSASYLVFVKIAARIVIQVIRKFWAFSSAALLALILFYWLCGGFFAFMLVVFGFTGILYHAGDRLLYHPEQPNTSRVYVPSPSVAGLLFDSVYIRSRDSTRLHLFLVKQPDDKLSQAPTILYLHGNAGNIGEYFNS